MQTSLHTAVVLCWVLISRGVRSGHRFHSDRQVPEVISLLRHHFSGARVLASGRDVHKFRFVFVVDDDVHTESIS